MKNSPIGKSIAMRHIQDSLDHCVRRIRYADQDYTAQRDLILFALLCLKDVVYLLPDLGWCKQIIIRKLEKKAYELSPHTYYCVADVLTKSYRGLFGVSRSNQGATILAKQLLKIHSDLKADVITVADLQEAVIAVFSKYENRQLVELNELIKQSLINKADVILATAKMFRPETTHDEIVRRALGRDCRGDERRLRRRVDGLQQGLRTHLGRGDKNARPNGPAPR